MGRDVCRLFIYLYMSVDVHRQCTINRTRKKRTYVNQLAVIVTLVCLRCSWIFGYASSLQLCHSSLHGVAVGSRERSFPSRVRIPTPPIFPLTITAAAAVGVVLPLTVSVPSFHLPCQAVLEHMCGFCYHRPAKARCLHHWEWTE
ncbi:uncharacterized protein EV420DRAFT_365565 [Desarmillaria tabescens]|uniref:Uncharacterized protein n=1 Tax=Armillaria tabescens TaxID=1929756 RepID=A0AA39KCG0_ARMTA|nr:uncharacterized protein EV420DRAFT_365565 [Desarmillaria tabescens]KAK0458575.1 hypothetical protein EV420DRAFT_365565 [Desarmillaria tabescens]